MRTRPFVIRAIALFAILTGGGAGPAAAQEPVTETSGSPRAIAGIRAHFAQIERELPRYRRTRHDLYDLSLENEKDRPSLLTAARSVETTDQGTAVVLRHESWLARLPPGAPPAG